MLTSNSENHLKKYSLFCSERHFENPKPQNSVTFGPIQANQKPSFNPTQSQHNSIPTITNSNPTHRIKGNFFQILQFHQLFLLLNFCFVHPIFRFWFLVTFGNKVTKIRKYYVIFVYILQGKMGKTEKNGKKITQLK